MKTHAKLVSLIALAAVALTGCGSDGGTGPEELGCSGGTALAVGQTVNGTLEQGDDLDIDGAYQDRYALTVEQGGTIEISMSSSDLDAFLWLLSTGEGVIETDDDGGDGLDARISTSLESGCYLVDATTFPDFSGGYELSVQRL